MALAQLTCDKIGDLDDGLARLIVNREMAEFVRDIEDRGSDGKPRHLDIRVTGTLLPDGRVDLTLEAAVKVPKRHTASTTAKPRPNSEGEIGLFFQERDPADPDQRTLDEAMDEAAK